jgi:hypothetical protein
MRTKVLLALLSAWVGRISAFSLGHAPRSCALARRHGVCASSDGRQAVQCPHTHGIVRMAAALDPPPRNGLAEESPAGRWRPSSGKPLLVILIGFLGCTPGIIAKYSQTYQEMGAAQVETIEVLPSSASMLLAHQVMRCTPVLLSALRWRLSCHLTFCRGMRHHMQCLCLCFVCGLIAVMIASGLAGKGQQKVTASLRYHPPPLPRLGDRPSRVLQ